MDFETWIADAWNRHADAPDGVLAELATTGAALAGDDAGVDRLLRLAHHLIGAHQGQPEALHAGGALLVRLAGLPVAGAAARASAALYGHSLAVTAGQDGAARALGGSERVRVLALAAANLADREPTRAGALLAEAAAAAESAALPDSDPAVRALAVAGNNIAAALEERPERDPALRTLMLQAAELALVMWRCAGGWLEEERAHHRLAVCAAKAGDAALALAHARACLAIVQREGDVALEAFFGCEALARAEAAAGHAEGRASAVQQAAAHFERLAPDDQAWCRETLLKLRAPLP